MTGGPAPRAADPTLAERLRRLSIRDKLLALVLAPLLVAGPLLGLLLLGGGSVALDRALIAKVRSDLAVANGYFDRVLAEVGGSAAAVADAQALNRALPAVLASPALDAGTLVPLLQRLREREGVDFLALRAADGRLLLTDAGVPPDARATSEVPEALRPAADGRLRATVEVIGRDDFARLAPRLQWRVPVPLVPTRNAAPTGRTQEERAMVALATSPVRDAAGRVRGHLQAGVLLNRNLPFIDHINEIVYPEGALPFGSRGTATLFLDDVRISTNVRLFTEAPAAPQAEDPARDHRAIGTRVSQAVREAVLGRGSTWLDRAFVVNDWYVSAYQPITDGAGRRVGMLYVGFLEQPFTWVKYGLLAVIGALYFAVMTGAAWFSLRVARSIFQPIERMARTMQRVESGEGSARVGEVGSQDEVGRLAGHLDRLLDVIDEKTRTLQRWNAELDGKVAARTRELERAQAQLVRSEKMAAVGQLTAGVAHEINNPIAVIQGNLDLVRELLGPEGIRRVEGELRLADEQIERMRLIVTQLLQFARPGEFAGYVEAVDVGRLFEDCLLLAGHLLSRSGIEVERRVATARQPAINRNELQQVIVNLVVNAIHAMPEGGRLELSARDGPGDTVEIAVADTGPGLSDELIAELFQPFVTRKKDGTGLGLWISRSIVERYAGEIRAGHRTDGARGAVFTLVLHTGAEPAGR